MLTWHYRSRSEDLVAFNNAHFYDGRLRMAPRPRELTMRHPPLVAETGVVPLVQVKEGVDALLDRSVSLHSTRGRGIGSRRIGAKLGMWLSWCGSCCGGGPG